MQTKESNEKESRLLHALLLMVAMFFVLADPVSALEFLSQLH